MDCQGKATVSRKLVGKHMKITSVEKEGPRDWVRWTPTRFGDYSGKYEYIRVLLYSYYPTITEELVT